jgi:hypothetical protein
MSIETTDYHDGGSRRSRARSLAYWLGWLSIGLGVLELKEARRIAYGIGRGGGDALVTAYGWRELLSGMAILAAREPNRLIWGRVAGDVLDLASIAPMLAKSNPSRANAIGAAAFVAGAMLVDLYVARLDGRR